MTLETTLRRTIKGDVLFDAASRGRYSTDASIYQIEPVGIVIPRDETDLGIALDVARDAKAAILPRGAGPAMQDLLAGNADMMFDGMGTSAAQIRAKRLIGLAVATPQRNAEFPDIPTAAEIGVPNWIVSTWYGLWAIKGTPQPVVDRMHAEVVKALANPKLQQIWKDQTAQVGGESQAEFAKRIRAEIEKWQKVVTAAGVKLD